MRIPVAISAPAILVLVLLAARLSHGVAAGDRSPRPRSKAVDFGRDIYPLLNARCFECHRGADATSGVRLDLRAELVGETTGRPLVVPGRSEDSRLIELVSGRDAETVMPPHGPRLSDADVKLLERWIDRGAAWDDDLLLPAIEGADHWAFQPVRRPNVPVPAHGSRAVTPVDAFILARLNTAGLEMSPRAPARTLIRRLYLDLVGFPPLDDEVERFAGDESLDAWPRLVDRVLASPRYGERWGRHWLTSPRHPLVARVWVNRVWH
ncbi:MAG: PSD1 and planctomycete cytochrome C domain-containing protein, partial [Planctomycetes bacterium]|nr:PSD1 and planctomycete cytochrome C domain-containing protein [Planctomycetota bacterium]